MCKQTCFLIIAVNSSDNFIEISMSKTIHLHQASPERVRSMLVETTHAPPWI